jgi:hypothetical protein
MSDYYYADKPKLAYIALCVMLSCYFLLYSHGCVATFSVTFLQASWSRSSLRPCPTSCYADNTKQACVALCVIFDYSTCYLSVIFSGELEQEFLEATSDYYHADKPALPYNMLSC